MYAPGVELLTRHGKEPVVHVEPDQPHRLAQPSKGYERDAASTADLEDPAALWQVERAHERRHLEQLLHGVAARDIRNSW